MCKEIFNINGNISRQFQYTPPFTLWSLGWSSHVSYSDCRMTWCPRAPGEGRHLSQHLTVIAVVRNWCRQQTPLRHISFAAHSSNFMSAFFFFGRGGSYEMFRSSAAFLVTHVNQWQSTIMLCLLQTAFSTKVNFDYMNQASEKIRSPSEMYLHLDAVQIL